MSRKITVCIVLVLFFSCKTTQKSLFYNLSDFNVVKASGFVEMSKQLPQISSISIVDTQRERNEFRVNNKHIFNDTIQANQPNFYSYKKFANEIEVDEKSLNELLLLFSQIKVSEFIRERDFYLFPVEEYALSKQTGYIFTENNAVKPGDTLFTKKVIGDKIVLRKKVDENWFQYESEK